MDEKFTAPSLPVLDESDDEQQKEMIGGGLPFSSSRFACTLATTTKTASPTLSPLLLPFSSGHSFPIALLLLVLLCAPNWQLVTALPRPAVDSATGQQQQQQQLPLQRHVPVGSLFTMENSGQLLVDKSKLPGWIKVTADQKLVGIPQLRDVGTHRLALNNGQTIELNVGEDQDGVCGTDTATIWLEVIDPRQLGKLGVEEQFHAAQTVLSKLREGTGVEIQTQDLRLFPHFYLNRYRTVTETMHESADAAAAGSGGGSTVPIDQLVFMLNISCGELSEQGSEIISAAADAGLNVRVVQGSLRKSRLLPTTTQPTTTTTAVTTTTTISATKAHADSALSAHLITIIVVIVLLILVVAVAMCWVKNKQSRKRQKQTDTVVGTATNGKGTSSASGPTAAAAGISMTTPMLPSNGADGGGESGGQQQSVTTKS